MISPIFSENKKSRKKGDCISENSNITNSFVLYCKISFITHHPRTFEDAEAHNAQRSLTFCIVNHYKTPNFRWPSVEFKNSA